MAVEEGLNIGKVKDGNRPGARGNESLGEQ